MKILMTGFPTMGGSGMITTRLGVELANRGFEVHFMFYKRPFFLNQEDLAENITFHEVTRPDYALFTEIGSPYSIQAASKLSEIIRDHKIDLVHSHYAIPHAVVSYLATKIHHAHSVVTTHGSDTHTLGVLTPYNPVISFALKQSSQVTAVSQYLATETEKIFNLDHGSVETIYDFVNTDLFIPSDQERELSIVQASNFRPVKQVPQLVNMFAKIASDFPEWKLKLVGDGPDFSKAFRMARRNNVQHQVEFVGIQKNIPELFANSSIIASSSKIESFGLTLAEGMSCETPIWAPKVGGIGELTEDGQGGYLYNPNDEEGAVEKLASLMADRSKRERMGEKARQIIKNNFSLSMIVDQYQESYYNILDQRIDKIHTSQG